MSVARISKTAVVVERADACAHPFVAPESQLHRLKDRLEHRGAADTGRMQNQRFPSEVARLQRTFRLRREQAIELPSVRGKVIFRVSLL